MEDGHVIVHLGTVIRLWMMVWAFVMMVMAIRIYFLATRAKNQSGKAERPWESRH